jgi:hypothetical protein
VTIRIFVVISYKFNLGRICIQEISSSNKYYNMKIIDLYHFTQRMRWAGHVALMGRRGMHIGYWWGSQKERYH